MHSLPEHLERMKQALLHKKNKKAAWTVINEYFHFIGIESIKEELWILTKGTITNDLMDQSKKGADRHNLIFGYELLLLFFDAVKVLHDKREHKQKEKVTNRELAVAGNEKPGKQQKCISPV
jgi:hypothetical protein